MVGKKPEKRPFGRTGPLKGYPKDQSLYADPENWRYPLHTSWHVRAARRYFDDPTNRGKYSQEEQDYIDWRINEAIEKSSPIQAKAKLSPRNSRPTIPDREIGSFSLGDLLRTFLGSPRLKRAREMDDSLVSITQENSNIIEGRVKEYVFRIDLPNRTISHNCQDWINNMESKNMCKHLGKLFLMLDEGKSTNILRQVLKEKDSWLFTAYIGKDS